MGKKCRRPGANRNSLENFVANRGGTRQLQASRSRQNDNIKMNSVTEYEDVNRIQSVHVMDLPVGVPEHGTQPFGCMKDTKNS
jgi:hypothetical protein